MRELLAAAVALTVAGAVSPGEPAPESRAHVGFSFGGARIVPRDFHYGLRLDHDSRFVDGCVPPLLQIDFTRRGFNDARINGMNLVRRAPRLRQAEEPAPAEAPEAPVEPGSSETPPDPDSGADGDAGTDPGVVPGILPAIIAGSQARGAYDFLPAAQNMSPEYQEGLDGGTGHMGDLGVHE